MALRSGIAPAHPAAFRASWLRSRARRPGPGAGRLSVPAHPGDWRAGWPRVPAYPASPAASAAQQRAHPAASEDAPHCSYVQDVPSDRGVVGHPQTQRAWHLTIFGRGLVNVCVRFSSGAGGAGGSGRTHGGGYWLQRGRLTPQHRHFGEVTSRTRHQRPYPCGDPFPRRSQHARSTPARSRGQAHSTGCVTAVATTASHPLRFQPRPMSPPQPASEEARTVRTVCAGRHHPVTRSLKIPVGCEGQRGTAPRRLPSPPAAAAAPPFQDLANPGLLTAAGPPHRRQALPSDSPARKHSPAVPSCPFCPITTAMGVLAGG